MTKGNSRLEGRNKKKMKFYRKPVNLLGVKDVLFYWSERVIQKQNSVKLLLAPQFQFEFFK